MPPGNKALLRYKVKHSQLRTRTTMSTEPAFSGRTAKITQRICPPSFTKMAVGLPSIDQFNLGNGVLVNFLSGIISFQHQMQQILHGNIQVELFATQKSSKTPHEMMDSQELKEKQNANTPFMFLYITTRCCRSW